MSRVDDLLKEWFKEPLHLYKHNIGELIPGVTEEDICTSLAPLFEKKKGRAHVRNFYRDYLIEIAVTALQKDGYSFRGACSKVAPFVPLSSEAVISICQKMRKP